MEAGTQSADEVMCAMFCRRVGPSPNIRDDALWYVARPSPRKAGMVSHTVC